jgi:hypothetical protein
MEFDNKQHALDMTMACMQFDYQPGSDPGTDEILKDACHYLMACDGSNGDQANPRKLAALRSAQ